MALSDGGTLLVSGSVDATAKVWRLDQLSPDPQLLTRRLEAATTLCLSAEQRVRELGEDPVGAASARADCEARYRR